MPQTRKPLKRLFCIAAFVKLHPEGVTCEQILRHLRQSYELECCEKTIRRDIKYLQVEEHAPIIYDASARGYRLTREWELCMPFCESEQLLGALLSSRIAESMLPTAAARDAFAAADYLIAGNGEEALENLRMDTLLTDNRSTCQIPEVVWNPVVLAWAQRRILSIHYVDRAGTASQRECEPHYLALRNGSWYIHCYDLARDGLRSFALHRIQTVTPTERRFAERDGFLDQVRASTKTWEWVVPSVKIQTTGQTAEYVRKNFANAKTEDSGAVTVMLSGIRQFHLLAWVFRARGECVVLEPAWLTDEIRQISRNILDAHRSGEDTTDEA